MIISKPHTSVCVCVHLFRFVKCSAPRGLSICGRAEAEMTMETLKDLCVKVRKFKECASSTVDEKGTMPTRGWETCQPREGRPQGVFPTPDCLWHVVAMAVCTATATATAMSDVKIRF